MSILLESLEQKTNSLENETPDINSSHFDDEMLGDEWLVQRVKNWKITSLILSMLLIGSWIYFYSQSYGETKNHNPNPVSQHAGVSDKNILNEEISSSIEEIKNGVSAGSVKSEKAGLESTSIESKIIESTSIKNTGLEGAVSESLASDSKVVYRPKKRQKDLYNSEDTNSSLDNDLRGSERDNTSKKLASNRKHVTASDSNAVKLFLSELPLSLQTEFPSIELGSYVVSDDSKNSFVILDGQFYKANQIIAPNLILREITNQHILVEFHNYFVKLPHN